MAWRIYLYYLFSELGTVLVDIAIFPKRNNPQKKKIKNKAAQYVWNFCVLSCLSEV